MTVKQLQAEIRRLTSEVNSKLKELTAKYSSNTFFNKQLNRLKASTSYVESSTGEIRIPKSRNNGDILGLGFKGKNKEGLERQYRELTSFNTKEWCSAQAEKKRSDRANKAYSTFTRRYGNISFDEWEDFVLMMNDISDYIGDFGYEDIGGSIARTYVETRNKRKFPEYVREVAKQSTGRGLTPEDFIDRLTAYLFDEGEIDE